MAYRGSAKTSSRRFAENFLIVILAVLCIFLALRLIFAAAYLKVYVVGSSMQDTLTGALRENYTGGDYVYAIKGAKPRRGDIVVINSDPDDKESNKVIIKRVVVLENERFILDRGTLYINGKLYEEPYLNDKNNSADKEVNSYSQYADTPIPSGYVFCMGDNRNNSEDSRGHYGVISYDQILGVVADWSVSDKKAVTAFNTFFDFTLPKFFAKK